MHAADFANPWIVSADSAPRRARGWIVAPAAAVLGFAALWIGQAGAGLILPVLEQGGVPLLLADGRLHVLVVTLMVFGLLILGGLAGALVEGRNPWLGERNPALALAGGLALGAAGLSLVVGLAALAGGIERGADLRPGPGVLVLGLALIALQVAAEEVFFRGWLQPVLCARWGPWLGVAVAAVLFAGLHLAGGARSPTTLTNLVLGGALFGVLALRAGGLWAPFGAHFAWNSIEAMGLGLEPDPGAGPFGALFNLELVGGTAWTGGADRLNGSPATTLVLAALVLLFAAWGPRRRVVSA